MNIKSFALVALFSAFSMVLNSSVSAQVPGGTGGVGGTGTGGTGTGGVGTGGVGTGGIGTGNTGTGNTGTGNTGNGNTSTGNGASSSAASAFSGIQRGNSVGATAGTGAGFGLGATQAAGGLGGFGGAGGFGGLGGLGGFGNMLGNTGGSSSTKPTIRTRLRSAIEVAPPTTFQVQQSATQHFMSVPNADRFSGVNINVQQGTTVLGGVVRSERERRMSELLLRLEPGVQRIENRIIVSP